MTLSGSKYAETQIRARCALMGSDRFQVAQRTYVLRL